MAMDEACRLILAWLEREFPSPAHPPEHWLEAAPSGRLPPTSRIAPAAERETVEVFAKRNVPVPAPQKELAVARQAVENHRAAAILAALRSQGVARRLRKAPAIRLLLDPNLVVRPWGRSATAARNH